MDVTLDGVSSLVGALAWPLAALLIAFVFRAPLAALLQRDDVEISALGSFSVSARGQQAAAASLMEASEAKPGSGVDTAAAERTVKSAVEQMADLEHRPQILWVDDNPSNNRHEVSALNSLGMHVSLSTSTEDALRAVGSHGPYDLIISDMSRGLERAAGYDLLRRLRDGRHDAPFLIYASSRSPEHFDEAVRRGALGCTNRPDELIQMVSNALWHTPRRAVSRNRPTGGRRSG